MKKYLFLILMAATTAVSANAQQKQKTKFAIKAGLNLSQIAPTTFIYTKIGDIPLPSPVSVSVDATKMTPNFFIALSPNFALGDFFGIQPEVMFSMAGGTRSFGTTIAGYQVAYSEDVNINYLDFPILFEIKPIPGFSLFAGPQLGIKVYSSVSDRSLKVGNQTYTNNDIDTGIKFNAAEFSVAVGAQLALGGRFLLSGRYNIGVTSIEKKTDARSTEGNTNRVLQFGVGYQF